MLKLLLSMTLGKIYNLYKALDEESILLSFKGVFTADLLTSILQIMESKLSYLAESPKIKKKMFNVLVECLQNLYHHVDDSEMIKDGDGLINSSSALLMITIVEGSFFIRTGNYVFNEASVALEDRLKKINSLDKEDLKSYYQKVLNDGNRSQKGTAGLGMIDIARKSGNKLEYEFVEAGDNHHFFCLNIKID